MAKSNFEPACCTDHRNCHINLCQLWELSEMEINMNFYGKAQRAAGKHGSLWQHGAKSLILPTRPCFCRQSLSTFS